MSLPGPAASAEFDVPKSMPQLTITSAPGYSTGIFARFTTSAQRLMSRAMRS